VEGGMLGASIGQNNKLQLMGVQEVKWERSGPDYTFFYGEGNGDHQIGSGFSAHDRFISEVRKV
jgi:hypothetical protein